MRTRDSLQVFGKLTGIVNGEPRIMADPPLVVPVEDLAPEDGEGGVMEVVRQVEPLSLGWCLDCHRNPEAHLRPKDQVRVMDWVPEEEQATLGRKLKEAYGIDPSVDCSTCHR